MAAGAILARYGVLEKVGIHLIHGHFELVEDTVLVGTNYDNYRFAKATKLDDLHVNNIHGHIYALTESGFRAYEYQTGKPPDLSGIDVDAFLEEFSSFLKMNNLETLVALQILDANCKDDMVELVFPSSTIMVRGSKLRGCVKSRGTGWRFEIENGQLRECKANETHGETGGPDGHLIYNEGAPHPKTFQEVVEYLVLRGLIST